MGNINRKSPARWIFLCAAMSLAVSAQRCFAQGDQNALRETMTILATLIAVVSAIVAVIAAVIASRGARAAMKSAFEAMVNTQKNYGGTLLPSVTLVNQKIDWAKNFTEAIDTPLAIVLTIIFSIALGVSLSIFLSRSDSSSAVVSASKPASPAATASVSAAPLPTAAAASGSMASVSRSPPPTSAARAPANAAPRPIFAAREPDHSEIASLLASGRTSLSHGDLASARVSLSRAAELDDPEAAFALGETYDPTELKRIGIPNFQSHADPAKAREWYRRAADLGSADAISRLGELSLRRILVDELKERDR
jgi:hypothetical protein